MRPEEQPPHVSGLTPQASSRDRHVLLWWGVGLGLLAALALVCWIVVRPCVEVRRAAGRCAAARGESVDDWWTQARQEVARLGGAERAAPKLRLYLKLPERLAPERVQAAWMLLLTAAECSVYDESFLGLEGVELFRLTDGRVLCVVSGGADAQAPWFILARGGECRKIGENLAAMHRVVKVKASSDQNLLAVISAGEGHPVLEVASLPDLLAEGKLRVLREIDPYPGGIEVVGWEGRKLIVESGMPLDWPLAANGRVATTGDPLLVMLKSPARFSLDTDSGRIVRLPAERVPR